MHRLAGVLMLVCLLFILIAAQASSQDSGGPEEWPTANGNPARTGFYGDIPGPGTGEVIWRFETGTIDVTPTPAVAHNRVYIGAADDNLYALDAATGQKIWEYKTGGPISASAAVSHNKVFVGSRDGSMYAINAHTGELVWKVKDLKLSRGAPTVNDDTVYFGSRSGILYALNIETGEKRWALDLSGLGHHSGIGFAIPGSPLVHGGNVYFGAADHRLYSVNAKTGVVQWIERLDGTIGDTISVYNDRLISSTGIGTVYAISANNGTALWTDHKEPGSHASPAIENGMVYRITSDGIYALDLQSGEEVWHYLSTQGGTDYLAASSSTIWTVDLSGIVIALDAHSGEELWRNHIAAHIPSSPVVVDGVLYVGSSQFYVFALDAGAGLDKQPSSERSNSYDRQVPTPGAIPVGFIILAGVLFFRRLR